MTSKEFKQNVQSGNLVRVRSVLLDYLIIDRSFKMFDDAFDYAKSKLNILQSYDGKPLEKDPEKWDKNYLNRQKVALIDNFSQERINHIKKVIEKVLPKNVEEVIETPAKSIKDTTDEKKTGRTTLSEKRVKKQGILMVNNSGDAFEKRENTDTHETKRTSTGSAFYGKTGSKVVNETKSEIKRTEEKRDYLGLTLIVGGVGVAALGLVAVEEVVVAKCLIGAGVVLTGAGIGVEVKNKL